MWCFDRFAGTLVDAPSGPTFTYASAWLGDGMPPLSQSLPLDGTFGPLAAAAFFGGLLPEGTPRELLARRLGVSPSNDFGMLAAVGGDTAGAISLQPAGQEPRAWVRDVEWLDDDALITLVVELPSRPMHADEDGEYRLSLAGVQDKLPVVMASDGRIGLTKGQTPSTHILKTPIPHLAHTVVNEAFCPAVGRALGVDAVTAKPRRVADREFLLIERYDRRIDGNTTHRLHQEDFCQALGIPTARKYEAEGGPSLADCFDLLRTATEVPAQEIVKLLDYIVLSFLVGNHDAHGKNYSLLYLPDNARPVLAPAYDIISTFAYQKSNNLTRKMAMKIGGQYKPDYLERRHLDRLLGDAGLGAAAARRRLRAHADAAPSAARKVRTELARDGWDAPIFDIIIAIVDRRAGWLRGLAAPMLRAPTSSPAPRVRAGQQWRNSNIHDGGKVSVITVDQVDADGTVLGSSRVNGSGDLEEGTWTVRDFDSFALIADPGWQKHNIAARLDPDDPRAQKVYRFGGELEGTRSHNIAAGGLSGPETCWRIIAPSEEAALSLVMSLVGRDVPVRAAMGWRDEP